METSFSIEKDNIKADSYILAIPISAYNSVAQNLTTSSNVHLINVCSVQSTSTNILLNYTNQVTSIHPLFGKRTPLDKRNSILTHKCGSENERVFLEKFSVISSVLSTFNGENITPDIHDRLMSKTHVAAVMAAKQMKIFVDRADDIPDELIPNSFRLLRQFVKTLDDMPQGTMESIMANPYF